MKGLKDGYGLEIKQIEKSFGTQQVLKGIDLTIEKGEFVAIVGKSGCGKSTLLRLIKNLDTPGSGTILIEGKQESSLEEEVKFLFQEPRLLPWKKVWKNIALVTQHNSRAEVLEALTTVGLEEHADKWPAQLSGGQRQRVALARALASDPKLLLLDEPLGALDALTRIEMQRLIESLWEAQQFTAILVTHDVGEAIYLADRVVLIEEGRITLNQPINLARPRIHDDNFVFYERKILNAILGNEEEVRLEAIKNKEYSI